MKAQREEVEETRQKKKKRNIDGNRNSSLSSDSRPLTSRLCDWSVLAQIVVVRKISGPAVVSVKTVCPRRHQVDPNQDGRRLNTRTHVSPREGGARPHLMDVLSRVELVT